MFFDRSQRFGVPHRNGHGTFCARHPAKKALKTCRISILAGSNNRKMIIDDRQLLGQYAREHSEPAFGELVRRHVDLVYAAALRIAGGDSHLAEDVTQTVFIDLARKAPSLPADVLLAGWLYRHASFTASKAVRTERRRKNREQTAMEMRELDEQTESSWKRIAPHLEESLNQLKAGDRDAIVLRFLKRQDFKAVGAALGVNEDAAQKRVSRALEKLRGVLSRRGIPVTGAALASVLAAQTVTAAPSGLAASVAAASLAAASAGTGTSFAILKFMATTKLKGGIASAIIAASVMTPLMIYRHTQITLCEKDELLKRQAGQAVQMALEIRNLSNDLVQPTISKDPELLKLRGEIGRLRADIRELTPPKSASPASPEEILAAKEQMWASRVIQLKQWLEEHPSEKIPEFQYLTDRDWLNAVENKQDSDEEYRSALRIARANAERPYQWTMFHALQQYAKDNNGQFPRDLSQLKPFFKSPIDDAILTRYQIVPATSLVGKLQVGGDWLITQKAPINEALDFRASIGLTDMGDADESVTNRWSYHP
jgi:RNA polymerase sigma factor (sigma-70 family)